MRIGIFGGDTQGQGIDQIVAAARAAEAQGFASYWLPQIFGLDAITTLAIVGREVPRIELGTAVVPTYPRHPTMLASQALTTAAASGGRFTLGIGLSHQIVVEMMWGLSYDKPARHMREYLSILLPMLRDGSVSFTGETLTANSPLVVTDRQPVPVMIAALAPRMLELAGGTADGTITWMTGPNTLGDYIVPNINAAAARAGKPTPRVGASLPVMVTHDPDAARTRAANDFQVYGTLPSYRAMLDKEGASGPADVAIVGDESTVGKSVQTIVDAGVTDFVAAEFGSAEEQTRTREFLRTLL
jgi:5,10-methylenetetrahydromethanopterin reductase